MALPEIDAVMGEIEQTIGKLDKTPARPPMRLIQQPPGSMPEPATLDMLAAEALLKQGQAAVQGVNDVGKTLDEMLHVFVSTATADMDSLIARARETSDLINKTKQAIQDTSAAYGAFGKRMSAQITAAGELCRRAIAQCETLKREVSSGNGTTD